MVWKAGAAVTSFHWMLSPRSLARACGLKEWTPPTGKKGVIDKNGSTGAVSHINTNVLHSDDRRGGVYVWDSLCVCAAQ